MNRSGKIVNASLKNFALASAMGCGLLLVLPGCQIPKLQHPESTPILPDEFNRTTTPENTSPLAAIVGIAAVANHSNTSSSADNSSLLKIEEFYSDPILTNLIEQALATNRELKILDQEVQIARNDILARRGAYLPFMNFGGVSGIDKPSLYTRTGAVDGTLDILPGQAIPNPLADYGLGVNVFWQLDIWRQLRNARDAAAQRYTAAREKRNYFVTRLVAEVAENYYRLMALDKRIEYLNVIIDLQEESLRISEKKRAEARGTALPVQRFRAEVEKNQSEKLIVRQEIVEVENRINFLLNRFPEPVQRTAVGFLDLNIHALSLGVPSQLLENRPDIRQAERELTAAGLDLKVARARFFPTLTLTGGVAYEAFNPKYLFNPEAVVANVAGNLAAPLINKKAIQADYLTANARQLEAVYNYQRVVVNAFTEVINRISMVENYRRSIEIKRQQLASLEASVETATKLLLNAAPGVDYLDVLFAQRDLMDARLIVIATKQQQLSAIVNTFQALGGGDVLADSSFEPASAIHRKWWKHWGRATPEQSGSLVVQP